jgi:hypothetical protein
VSLSSLNDNERQILRDSIVRDLLFEREGDDEKFDLCVRFYKLAEVRRFDPRNCEWMVDELKIFKPSVTGAEVKELWNLIVREAYRSFDAQCQLFDCGETREVLPPLSKGLEIELLRIVRGFGYHRKLIFTKNEFGYSTMVKDQFGSDMEITMSKDSNPLSTGLAGRDNIAVLAKLTPAMIPKGVRDDNGNFIKQEEQGFRLSHVTLLN